MKKMSLLLIMLGLLLSANTIHASSDYMSFESIELASGSFLSDFSSSDYKKYYKKVNKRRFMGWRTHEVNRSVKVTYITETLFSYYNNGYTPIDYEYQVDYEQTEKVSLSATGSVRVETKKTTPGFKNNLDSSLKLSSTYQSQSKEKEKINLALKIDPGTQVDLYIYGEGKISNGVAQRYIFWFRADRGGYEVFVVTTQYHRLEKIKI